MCETLKLKSPERCGVEKLRWEHNTELKTGGEKDEIKDRRGQNTVLVPLFCYNKIPSLDG